MSSEERTKVLVYGAGPALVAMATRLHAAGRPVSAFLQPELFPTVLTDLGPLAAAGIPTVQGAGGDVAPALVGVATVVIADELAIAGAGSELLTGLLAAAAAAGVTAIARWTLVGANGGSWMRHRFGANSLWAAHNDADAQVAKCGVPATFVHGGLSLQTFETSLAPLCLADGGVVPNVLSLAAPVGGTSGVCLVDAGDVADVIIRQLDKGAFGKHLGCNGSRPVSLPELVGLIDGSLTVGPVLTPEALSALLGTVGLWTEAQIGALVGAFALASRGALSSTSADVHMALGRDEVGLEAYFRSGSHKGAWVASGTAAASSSESLAGEATSAPS